MTAFRRRVAALVGVDEDRIARLAGGDLSEVLRIDRVNGISVVAKGGAPKPEADAVTRGMTASVVACTLWVVAWELFTVVVVLGS